MLNMEISIRGEHLEVTEALRDYVDKKLSRLERYFEAPLTSDVQVKLSVVKGLQAIEVGIPLIGVLLRAEERNNDMYASIDLVVDKLERQIRKHKTRTNRKIRQDGGKRDLFKVEMNLVGHNFFVFSNMDTDQVNVVYKRDDGKYGLIEPAV
jgi:putative sigma-54 modulation protein